VRKTFRLPDKEFKTKFGISKPETNTEIIVYCREGRRAQDAVMSFVELGYRNNLHLVPIYSVLSAVTQCLLS